METRVFSTKMNAVNRRAQGGFTIVELLIVIVVIGILAAITVVAFNGVQERARDAERKTGLSNVAKALQMYKIDHGSYPNASSGCSAASGGAGNGWLNLVYSGTSASITGCLINDGKLSTDIIDPSGSKSCTGATCHAYMFYVCGAGAFLMANLESLPQDEAAIDNANACATSWDTAYGINYIVKVS